MGKFNILFKGQLNDLDKQLIRRAIKVKMNEFEKLKDDEEFMILQRGAITGRRSKNNLVIDQMVPMF